MDLQPGEGEPISESAYSQGEGNLYQRVLIAGGGESISGSAYSRGKGNLYPGVHIAEINKTFSFN